MTPGRDEVARVAETHKPGERLNDVDRIATGESLTEHELSSTVQVYNDRFGCLFCGHRDSGCTPIVCTREANR